MKYLSISLFALCSVVLAPTGVQAANQATLAYEAKTTDFPPQNIGGGCHIKIAKVSDERNNKQTIGNEFASIESTDPVPWVGAGFDNLSAWGFAVDKESASADAVSLDVRLLRAYTWHGNMRINATVALELVVRGTSGQTKALKIRASGSKSNWAGATSEYATTLNYALNAALAKAAVSLRESCKKP